MKNSKANNRRYQKFTGIAAAAGAVALALVAPAAAQDSSIYQPAEPLDSSLDSNRIERKIGVDSAREIAPGGEVVLRFRDNVAGMSPEERADTIRGRLTEILGWQNLTSGDVEVRWLNQDTSAIYVRDQLLVTVGQSLADANNSKPHDLAQLYAERFRRILPQVVAQPYGGPYGPPEWMKPEQGTRQVGEAQAGEYRPNDGR